MPKADGVDARRTNGQLIQMPYLKPGGPANDDIDFESVVMKGSLQAHRRRNRARGTTQIGTMNH